MKELMEVVSDEEGVAIDAIPLSTKPPSIVDYKIIKEGNINIYQIIRVDGSSKRMKKIFYVVNAACTQLVLLVQSYSCLFRVNAAGTKLQLLKD
ncbi:hypothetical protein Tco_1492354 [Tanacetum coccineum]